MLEKSVNRERSFGSVVYEEFDSQALSDAMHQHESYELVYVESGAGNWQMGRAHGAFSAGSLLLCPPRTLHLWRSGEGEVGPRLARGIVLRFGRRVLPESLLRLPEMLALRRLFEEADSGLVFEVADRDRLRTRLRSVDRATGALRLARMYVALELIAGYRRRQVSDSKEPATHRQARSSARFEAVRRFLERRFAEQVTRSEAAAHAGMEEAAFSRFFRSASGVTFADFLANLRIRHAATLLGNRRDLPVPEIARRSGFRNLGAFHRQFKRRLGTTPQAYRNAANSESMAP